MAVVDDLAGLELAIRENPERLIPLVGQLVDLTEPAQVAEAVTTIRDAKKQLDDINRLLCDVLRLEAARQGTKTLRYGATKVEISGGEKTDYDIEQLQQRLRDLGLPEDRLAELVTETVTYKVNARVAKSVMAANALYGDAIGACKTVEPAPWYVRVTVE